MPNQNTGSIPNKFKVCGKITKIFLNKNLVCIVDTDEYWKNLRHIHWGASKCCNTFYVLNNQKVNGRTKSILIHRIVNKTPNGKFTDHINRNGLDNRRKNLRTVDSRQNSFNTIKKNPTGFIGVHIAIYKNKKYYTSTISHGGKILHLGSFGSAKEAAIFRDKMAIKFRGEFALLNFPRRNYAD